MAPEDFVNSTKARIQFLNTTSPVLEELWVALLLGEQAPKMKIRAWLRKHDPKIIASAFEVAASWLDRQEEPDKVSEERKLKYIGKILSNAAVDSMTPEQKEQELSRIRSVAGKMGGRKKWQNDKNAICHDLPSGCSVCHLLPCACPRGSGWVSGSPSGSVSPTATDTGSGEDEKSKPAAAAPPVVGQRGSKGIGKPENREPKTVEPKPSPTPRSHAQGKVCPDCGEPLRRDVNHFLDCKVAKGNSTLDEYIGDRPAWRPNPNYGGEMLKPEEYYDAPPLDWKHDRTGETAGQKNGESLTAEGKPKPTPTDLPECEFCAGRCSCDDPVPPLESPRPMGINP